MQGAQQLRLAIAGRGAMGRFGTVAPGDEEEDADGPDGTFGVRTCSGLPATAALASGALGRKD